MHSVRSDRPQPLESPALSRDSASQTAANSSRAPGIIVTYNCKQTAMICRTVSIESLGEASGGAGAAWAAAVVGMPGAPYPVQQDEAGGGLGLL